MSGRGAGRINELAILGDWNAICDMCGRRFKASELVKNWKGLMVCADDWEPRHVLDFFRIPDEKIDVPFARTDPEEVFRKVGSSDVCNIACAERSICGGFEPSENSTFTVGSGTVSKHTE